MFIVPDPPLPSVLIGIYARVPLTVCQRIRNEERKRVKWRMFFIRSDFPFAPSAKQPKREHDFFPNCFCKLFTCLQSCHEFSTGRIENDLPSVTFLFPPS